MDVARAALVIASIRRATAHRHAALEAVLQLTPSLSHRRYINALLGFELFLSKWEPRIDVALPTSLRGWFASRSRRGLLRRDLNCLDKGRLTEVDVKIGCEQVVSGIDLSSVAATFGSIYVLEGSALGGQVIARMARATLGLDADNGAAYFKGIDRDTAAGWTAFQILLEDQVGITPAARQAACDAATQTFNALIATFTSLHHDPATG